MSLSLIRNLTSCAALVLPLFLLSVQPTLASENKDASNTRTTTQQSMFTNSLRITVSKPINEQGAGLCMKETDTTCQRIQKTRPQNSQSTTRNSTKPAENNLVELQSGRPGNVFFNLINGTSVTLIGLFIQASGSNQPVEINLFGGDLVPGEVQRISVRGVRTCFYDLGFAYADGDSHIATNVNLCSMRNYTLYEQ
ncbi:MAG: hypothetical protein HC908_11720 [Calothrix sp. SM1_7_51]|nr:hypothetical protein [Calothrix sp. SM1_7_51]